MELVSTLRVVFYYSIHRLGSDMYYRNARVSEIVESLK